jgi:hypothetical protein
VVRKRKERKRTNKKREQVWLRGCRMGREGLGDGGSDGEEVEMRRRGMGARRMGWVRVWVCDELNEGVG